MTHDTDEFLPKVDNEVDIKRTSQCCSRLGLLDVLAPDAPSISITSVYHQLDVKVDHEAVADETAPESCRCHT